jgi:hypothetical protein
MTTVTLHSSQSSLVSAIKVGPTPFLTENGNPLLVQIQGQPLVRVIPAKTKFDQDVTLYIYSIDPIDISGKIISTVSGLEGGLEGNQPLKYRTKGEDIFPTF